MYLNRITLIGFIGSDAERKAANATNIAIFSLATKTSWKNDAGSTHSAVGWRVTLKCTIRRRLCSITKKQ